MGGYQGKEGFSFWVMNLKKVGLDVLEHGISLYFRPLLPPSGIVSSNSSRGLKLALAFKPSASPWQRVGFISYSTNIF